MKNLKDFNNEIEARKHFGEKPFDKNLKEKIIEIVRKYSEEKLYESAPIIADCADQILELFKKEKQESYKQGQEDEAIEWQKEIKKQKQEMIKEIEKYKNNAIKENWSGRIIASEEILKLLKQTLTK